MHVQDAPNNLRGDILNIYANNRVFLPPDHKLRNSLKNQFDGKIENRPPPKVMSPVDWIKRYEDAELKSWNDFFLHDHSIEQPYQVMVEMQIGMNRKSIFYDPLTRRIY